MKDLQQKVCMTEQANLGGKLEILSESERGQARGTFQRRSRAEVLQRFEMLSLPTIHNSEVIMVEVPHCPQLASMAPR